jgi:hypothetical protein
VSVSQPYFSRRFVQSIAQVKLAMMRGFDSKHLSSEETDVIFLTAEITCSRIHAVAALAVLRLIPASRVAQQSAYALDTSRANSSRSCIRSGAYC